MRRKFKREVERGRLTTGPRATKNGERFGAFFLTHPKTQQPLKVIVCDGDKDIPWDHVSVSTPNRCPTWEEMCWIKDCFWDSEEVVIQYHPAKSNYVNCHDFVLHLWMPTNFEIPMPPIECV